MYGSSAAAAAGGGKDLNRPFPAVSGAHHQMMMSSSPGLLRYRSAPSSILGEDFQQPVPVRPSSPDTETMFARFLLPDLRDDKQPPRPSASTGVGIGGGQKNPPPHFPPQPPPPAAAAAIVENLEEDNNNTSNILGGYSSAAAHMMFQQHQMLTSPSSSMEAGHHHHHHHQLNNGGSGSNLIRQSSSPAGYGGRVMRGIGGFNQAGLKSQLSFSTSSRQSSSSAGLMSQISEIIEDDESIGGYPVQAQAQAQVQPSWEDSQPLSSPNNNNFSATLKMSRDNQTHSRSGQVRNGLTHQFSLPKTSSEMAAIDKFLQFQDSVPCKIRAKRGCATHPRSIAERVRRTRISERMRKLQELVPNMDKQTNTSDMLDLAVDYIKDLQKQVKTLSDNRASCSCSNSKQKPYSNPSIM